MSAPDTVKEEKADEGPPLGLLIREKTRAYLTQFPYEIGTEGENSLPEARCAEFSPDGSYLGSIEGETQHICIRDAVTGDVVSTCGGSEDTETPLKVHQMIFSPKGTYVVAWSRPVQEVNVPNLVVYRTVTGERLASFYHKVFHVDFWPSIQWSDDESISVRAVTNTLHFFPGDALDKAPTSKIGIPGVTKCSLSHGDAPYTIAAFISGTKGGPGRFALYKHPDQGGDEIATRSTFRAESVTFLWNSLGSAVLALISTAVDTSGKSYYGESEVYFMNVAGSVNQRVDLPKEGPTYDAAWSPGGHEFVVIYGYMPSRATLFNAKCEPIFDFGTGARNRISFCPHGRFIALCGFGNLAGKVEFWDKNKHALVGRTNLPCTTMFSWSPCSRYFLGATTFPRLRVDNGFRIVRFDGKLIHEHNMNESLLHQATFRPAAKGVYNDPKFTSNSMIGGPLLIPDANGDSNSGNGANAKKSGVYRPPGARGAASFSLHQHLEAGKVDKVSFLASAHLTAANSSISSGRKKIVPGMDPEEVSNGPSKAALKRKRKKERERRAQVEKESERESSAAPSGNMSDITTEAAAQKRIKAINKKLRQIEALKISQGEGRELNEEQLAKLGTEPSLQSELEQVEEMLRSGNLVAE